MQVHVTYGPHKYDVILVPRFSLTYANCYCTCFNLHCLGSQFQHSF